MTSPEDPYDNTVWDPLDTEHAIEDSMHGPEAQLKLLSTPPMPLEDGSWYVSGALAICGTTTFDQDGHPYTKLTGGRGMYAARRLSFQLMDWIDKYHAGELPPLEEMDLPVFHLEEKPYLIIESPTQ